MTDKQIKEVFKNGFYCIEPCPEIKELQAELKHKEQECEAYKMEAEEGKEINAELKAENDELKRQRQSDKGLITATGKMNYELLQEYDKLKEEKQSLIKDWEEKKNLAYEIACKNEKLKQTLTEIKEITGKIANYYDGDEYELMRKDAEQILQKISECEGNDE